MSSSSEKPLRIPFEKLAGLVLPGDRLLSEHPLVAPRDEPSIDDGRLPTDKFSQLAALTPSLPDRACSADWRPDLSLLEFPHESSNKDLARRSNQPPTIAHIASPHVEVASFAAATASASTDSNSRPGANAAFERGQQRDPLLWWSLASASSALAASILVLIQINGLDRSNADLARQLAEFSKQPSSSGTIQAVSEHGSRLTTLEAEVERAFRNPIRKDDPRNWLSRLNARLMDLPPDVAKHERYSQLMKDVKELLKSLESSPDGPGNEVEPAVVRERVDRLYAKYLDSGNQSEK